MNKTCAVYLWVLRSVAIGCLFSISLQGQQRNPAGLDSEPSFRKARMPFAFWQHLQALGDRVEVKGKERSVLTGQFTDGAGSRAVTVIHQLPKLIRIEGVKARGGPLSFDGDRPTRGLSTSDEDVLESMVADTPEGMFSAAQGGAAVRLLGRNFGPDPRRDPKYNGPRYDIFEVTAEVGSRPGRMVRAKRYYFDSRTGLLMSTRYSVRAGSRTVRVETRFSSWGSVSGSTYSGRIERYEDGQLVFRFTANSVSAGPKQDVAGFRVP